jgi:uncharacterized membrane protein YhaH (DUF805 family)
MATLHDAALSGLLALVCAVAAWQMLGWSPLVVCFGLWLWAFGLAVLAIGRRRR